MLGRIVDPVAAFDGLSCDRRLSGELAFQLTDAFLPENSGIYVLRAEDGRIRALKRMFSTLSSATSRTSPVCLGRTHP